VGRVVFAAGLRGNPVVWVLINTIVPWDMIFGWLLARYRAELAERMPVWLDTWYELEALSSLATFAWLNPDYQFPVIHAEGGLQATALGHPLLPYPTKISNDFSLTETGTVVIITGSNMSGKSSFLRTLGVNLVLAYAGGVVDGTRFETPLFRVFSTIRVNDSLTEGFSYFYAEVRRLKALLNALQAEHPYPLFFLIDEIFKGTNNRERLIGSRAYIRALVGGNGMGVVSTHDLELVQLADEIPQVLNYHFREDVVDGRMIFDYKLRLGPCPTTNALKIMQLEGLPVEDL
jgi:DNA mismatch repair ATPase MutS